MVEPVAPSGSMKKQRPTIIYSSGQLRQVKQRVQACAKEFRGMVDKLRANGIG